MEHLIQNDHNAAIPYINRVSHSNQWKFISLAGLSLKAQNVALRLNSLGSPFYFIKVVLRKHRLSNNFHRHYCAQFEAEHLNEVFEVPRDHFKTTIGSEGMPVWWALPFNSKDERYMRDLGYDDVWIRWMYKAHDQNTRTLIAMEVIKNAWKVGKKISYIYKNEQLFRKLFPEVLPDNSCQWSQDTMTQMRDFTRSNANQGEGTFEFTGVDAALQSKHYNRIICDDLFGRDALKSETVAEATWDWFKLICGAFDSSIDPDALPDVIVNGNRWSYKDLNFTIKENLPSFKFHTHDAEGGCCHLHPEGQPLFPEEFSMAKLARLKEWIGEYYYSCQYRNRPIPPGGNKFKSEWLKHFVFAVDNISYGYRPSEADLARQTQEMYKQGTGISTTIYQPNESFTRRHNMIRHEVQLGEALKDIPTSQLYKMTIVDPNHAGEKGRARHAILTLGIRKNPFDIYLLDIFADNSSREDAIQEIYRQGEKWNSKNLFVEMAAGQSWLKTHFDVISDYREKAGQFNFSSVIGFKDNRSENAKDDRIDDMEPFFRRGQMWVNRMSQHYDKFKEEYEQYPYAKTKDILDVLALAVQNIDIDFIHNDDNINVIMHTQHQVHSRGRNPITGY